MVQSLHPLQLTLLLLFTSNFLQFALGKEEEEVLLPPWPSTYNMSLSTIIMPCNYTGYMDAEFAAKWGLVDFDWSNGKQLWANAKPMNCQELLVDFAAEKPIPSVQPIAKTIFPLNPLSGIFQLFFSFDSINFSFTIFCCQYDEITYVCTCLCI